MLHSDHDDRMRLLSDVCRYLHARAREIEYLTVQNARSRLSIYPKTLLRLFRSMVDEGILTVEDRVIFVHSLARLLPYD